MDRPRASQGEPSGDDKNSDLLVEVREKYTDFSNKWKETRDEGERDMEALSVEGPWPEAEKTARKDPKNPRPCEHIDIISQYNNRVVNQARMNKRGIKVVPSGAGADEKSATLREERIRQIEYESKAVRARLTAYQNAVDRGYGYYKVRTDFVDFHSFNQRIIIDRIPNPDSVLVDPYCKEADFSDQNESFVVDRLSREEFKRQYKKARIQSFTTEHMQLATQWVDENSVMVAEYWKRLKQMQRLLELHSIDKVTPQRPIVGLEDELKKADPDFREENSHILLGGQWWEIRRERESEVCQVKQYLTNGVEILDVKDWVGSTIPIIVVIGREKFEKGKRVVESLTRKLRAPQLSFDVAHTNQTETLGMIPKSKWVAAEGQLDDFIEEWETIHKSAKPFVRYRPKTDESGQNMLPPPQRIDYDPPVQSTELAKNSAIQAAQNAVGMNAPERFDRSQQSGIAQERIDQSGDINSYHFTDNFDMAIEYEGRIVNELLDKIEDSERMVGTRKADDSYKLLNLQPTALAHPYGPGLSHTVTVQTGPSYQSQRDAASDFADQLVNMDPAIFRIIGPLVVKLKDLGPIGDQIAKLLEFLQPPELKAQEDGQPQIPAQVQQQMQQMQLALKAATEQLQKLLSEREAETLKLQAKSQMQAYSDDVKLAIAELQAKSKMDATSLAQWMAKMDTALELLLQRRQQIHEVGLQAAAAATANVQPGAPAIPAAPATPATLPLSTGPMSGALPQQ